MGEIKKGVLKKMQYFLSCSEAMISFSRSETQHFLILEEEKIIFDRQIKNGKNPQKIVYSKRFIIFQLKNTKTINNAKILLEEKCVFKKNKISRAFP